MELNQVEKKSFQLASFTLECGQSIPITLGYETYGTLNDEKSNVILIAHYFSASSHAAGKYSPQDAAPGYWDGLIGPGKAIDTRRFFVIAIDNLCNVQWKNPKVITTGPRSVNPATGKRWGSRFPQFTFKDMVRIQHEFLTTQLGIEKLYAVAGASAGGFAAIEWAILYPTMLERAIGVITNPQNPVQTSFNVCQHAMRAIALDPKWQNGDYEDDREPEEGKRLAVQMMNASAFSAELYEQAYPRDSADGSPYASIDHPLGFETTLGNAVAASCAVIDASHWYYTCRATMLHDAARGHGSLKNALEKIQAKVLLVSCRQDQLQPTVYNRQMAQTLSDMQKEVTLVEIESQKGHMAGILDTHLFADDVRHFLK
ncbi:homoserine O-acetyltransferase [Leminorella grimontii]|uniref:Probable acyltransferase n=1 Tax=Leminorella grimontii TaxID=82981 RepID=A0AAV5MZI5_9GAMM|nr:homoserine O-acetyltransferase [Leminorella grimontii]KFC97549.1 homoserine O-acetyltransferase [Leminorella grimontii ATCC 33999 = DSM 5078]GKX55090.1 homoserine O-acetyltransferase [Leminorella grimontii]VFS56936.1 Homoserine O-acetyltransferase [Leminorella grimontii]